MMRRIHAKINEAKEVFEKLLSPLVYVAAALCLIVMVIYAGFEPTTVDKSILWKILNVCQGIFFFAVLFNIIFNTRKWRRDSLALKKMADIIVLLSIIPLSIPYITGSMQISGFFNCRTCIFLCLGFYSLAELSYSTMQLLSYRTNPSLILSCSFLFFIIIGSFILMLPRCTNGSIGYIDALFMASSAVSMTGLCTINAPEVFTPMGWTVIAVLMQIGALGVLTFTSFFALFFSGRSSIYNQLLMRDFIYSKSMSRLMPMLLYILGFTLTVELIGAVAVYLTLPETFLSDSGERAAFAVFHSLSAFCNGGFCPLPDGLADPALLHQTKSFYIVTTVLILAGGIGFPNLVNFKEVAVEYLHRIKARILSRPYIKSVHIYDLNTKLVLIYTGVLFIGGSIMFYIFEYNNTFAGLDNSDRLVEAIFSSATVRTAGFGLAAPQQWLGPTLLSAMMLMWIGCSSQSMGGGIKINAFAAVLLNLRSIVRGQKGITAFNRSIPLVSVRDRKSVV